MKRLAIAAAWAGLVLFSRAATFTLTTNGIGTTPEVLGYNCGHFYPGGNTRDWWRYSGVTGARVFLSPSDIEAADDLAPVGDGVSDQASFIARRAALRANPLSPAYINWSYFSNRYETVDLGAAGNNHLKVNYCLQELRNLGIDVCAQITASSSRFPILNAGDWPGKWELWQHYYAQAFYLGRVFGVYRYQMYNEPDLAGLTSDQFLWRLSLASDAIQAALADVNALFGKRLAPLILAPVNAGSAVSDYAGLGGLAVTNRHLTFLGATDPGWLNLQKYDFHEYDHSPATHAANLNSLHALLERGMAPEARFPTTISEFNTHTGANFDARIETLDSPAEYSRFGGICLALMSNLCTELYAFKFSQTERTGGNYPVAKNAMHYVDNSNAPYSAGGITRAGEVYRLFNKAFRRGRERLGVVSSGGASEVMAHAACDPVRRRYYLFSANTAATGVGLDLDLSGLPVPAGNRVLLEEVSETTYGGGRLWTNLPASKILSPGLQGAYSIWLLTVPSEPQGVEQVLTATDDAEVRDGANQALNYGSAGAIVVRNNPTNRDQRSAALMEFDLRGIAGTNVELAVLSLQASTLLAPTTAQAHVYALNAVGWSQSDISWSTAPNLKPGVPAGNTIARQWVAGVGETAWLVGQVVASSTNSTEKLLDVTEILRSWTNSQLSFLVSQDPRWDVALPSLAAGDTQPDGVRILTRESGNGPRLRIVMRQASPPPVVTPRITGILAQPDGSVSLSFWGATNRAHWVQVTTNVAGAWANVSTNVSGADGTWDLTDGETKAHLARFYRAVLP